MKLITEVNFLDNVNYIKEDAGEGKKQNYFIEGVFLQSNLQNRNGRVYPKATMSEEVSRYIKDNIDNKRAYGELGHPSGPTINLDRVSHMITSLKEDGDNFIGRAKFLFFSHDDSAAFWEVWKWPFSVRFSRIGSGII